MLMYAADMESKREQMDEADRERWVREVEAERHSRGDPYNG